MARHHYLGHLNKIGESIWYIALWRDRWVAQLSMSAAALKCGVRDRWIGWDFRTHYDRLCLIANNSRILILPDWHLPNVGSHKNTGAKSFESALGITSLTPSKAPPKRVLNINSGHWTIESTHYIIDRNFDEDRGRVRTAFGPENVTRLRRFAVGLLGFFWPFL